MWRGQDTSYRENLIGLGDLFEESMVILERSDPVLQLISPKHLMYRCRRWSTLKIVRFARKESLSLHACLTVLTIEHQNHTILEIKHNWTAENHKGSEPYPGISESAFSNPFLAIPVPKCEMISYVFAPNP